MYLEPARGELIQPFSVVMEGACLLLNVVSHPAIETIERNRPRSLRSTQFQAITRTYRQALLPMKRVGRWAVCRLKGIQKVVYRSIPEMWRSRKGGDILFNFG